MSDVIDVVLWSVYIIGVVCTAAFGIFLQGRVNNHFALHKRTSKPPVFLITFPGSLVWFMLLAGYGGYRGCRALYRLGDDRGAIADEFEEKAKQHYTEHMNTALAIGRAIESGDAETIQRFVAAQQADLDKVRSQLKAIEGVKQDQHLDLDKEAAS